MKPSVPRHVSSVPRDFKSEIGMMGSRAKYSSVVTKVGMRINERMRGIKRIFGPEREMRREVMDAVCSELAGRSNV